MEWGRKNLTHFEGDAIQGGMLLAVLNFRATILFHTLLEVGEGMRNSRGFLRKRANIFPCFPILASASLAMVTLKGGTCGEVILTDLDRYPLDPSGNQTWQGNKSTMYFDDVPLKCPLKCPGIPSCSLPPPSFAMILVQTHRLGSYQH